MREVSGASSVGALNKTLVKGGFLCVRESTALLLWHRICK